CGQAQDDVVESEVPVHTKQQLHELGHFVLDAGFGTEDMAVVLYEAAHTHQAMHAPGGLVAVAGAELRQTHGQVTVALQPLVEHRTWQGQFMGLMAYSRFSDSTLNICSANLSAWPDFSHKL